LERIVSFLPSATELIYALGEQNRLLGVTHECTYPDEAKSKPKVISTVIDSENQDSLQIDEATRKMASEGSDIFVLNRENIKRADPQLVVSQGTCEVCATHTNQVRQTMEMLGQKPMLHSMDPHNVREILDGVTEFARVIGAESKGQKLRADLEGRIQRIRNLDFESKPGVVAIEWVNPLFTAGHWVPEMIEIAGGESLIGSTGEHSRRMTIDEIVQAEPGVIIIMPCGFGVDRTKTEYERFLKGDKRWNRLQAIREGRAYAVDADSFFSKPSIRTVTGIEILAKILHPELSLEAPIPEGSFARLS